ncbi:MAG: 3-deoxy-manno-octulosonate cytidylyltransferase, partial [Coriobacteriia bacterium]|nr:3-deoxy-manno-octulosonate cytidylyltransferase [Coriobacteriia bacterium]
VVVATDDERIFSVVRDAGESVVMTSLSHASGTDRLAEVVKAKGLDDEDIVVNVQGDEPALDPGVIRKVAYALGSCSAGMATVATPIREASELMDPNVVKVTTDRDGFALAFSRAPIPWVRGAFALGETLSALPSGVPFLRHVGLYAYRVRSLRSIASQAPVALERAESLEQLRAMWLGIRIHVSVVEEAPGRGVDTEEDFRAVRALFEKRSAGSAAS